MALREILASFGVSFDDKELKEGHKEIESMLGSLKEFGEAVIAAFAVEKIFEFVHGLTEQAVALERQSQALGMSLDELQQWNFAAQMSGVSAEALSASLGKLSGGKYDKKALAALGVEAKDAGGELKTGADLLEDIAEALTKVDNPSQRNAMAMKVLGKNYKTLLPLLLQGADGIEKLKGEFDKLGGGFDEEFAKKGHEFDADIIRLQVTWKKLAIEVVGRVLPTFVKITDWLVKASPRIKEIIGNTEGLKAILILLGGAAVQQGFVMLVRHIGLLKKATLEWLLPLLLVQDFLVFLAGGKSVFGAGLDAVFGPNAQEGVRAFFKELIDLSGNSANESGDIWDRLATRLGQIGDTILASMKIFWLELKFGFLNVTAIVMDAFIDMYNGVIDGAKIAVKAAGYLVPGGQIAANTAADNMDKLKSAPGTWSDRVVADRARARIELTEEIENKGALLKKPLPKKLSGDDFKQGALANVAPGNDYDGVGDDAENGYGFRVGTSGRKMQTFERRIAPGQIGAPLPPNMTNHLNTTNNVNVTVPPGTPEDMAKKVGDAAANGASKGTGQSLRATAASLPRPLTGT